MQVLQRKTSSVFVKSLSATCRIVTVGSKMIVVESIYNAKTPLDISLAAVRFQESCMATRD